MEFIIFIRDKMVDFVGFVFVFLYIFFVFLEVGVTYCIDRF